MNKPKLSFWQIWNMSFGFLGIQFGFALQNANVSRIFETLGANKDDIPILWLAAPVTGLLVQPIIGYMSDRTWNSLGRRKPYFLIGAILASIALIFMPNSSTLWMAAGMLWIMDGSINVSMEPFRALVGDMLPSEQRTQGFAVQSFFIGIGAVVASALPYMLTNWFGVSNTAPKGEISPSVEISFYLGAFAFFTAVLWTILKTKEYPPEMMEKFEEGEEEEQSASLKDFFADFVRIPKTMRQLAFVQFFTWFALFSMWIYTTASVTSHIYDMKIDKAFTTKLSTQLAGINVGSDEDAKEEHQSVKADLDKVLEKIENGKDKVAPSVNTVGYLLEKTMSESELYLAFNTHFPSVNSSEEGYDKVKKEMEKLTETHQEDPRKINVSYEVVNFFDQQVKKGSITDASLAEKLTTITPLKYIQQEYNTGADFVGICFAAYSLFAALFAFLLSPLAGKIGRKGTHAVSLIAGALGLISIYFIQDPNLLIISMIGIGLAWASILSMPYAMLAGCLPPKKMGIYMGIFNFFIVIPQILASSLLGFFMNNFFDGEAVLTLVLGGVSMIVAAGLTMIVEDKDDVVTAEA
ncbi:MAG: MFS transporter [Flammeovirgaceae bacterium]